MAQLTLRIVKGSALTFQELDDNFTNLNNSKIEGRSGTLTTTSTTPSQILDLFPVSSVRTLKYVVQASNATLGYFHATTLMVIHNDTSVFLTEYGVVLSNTSLATFTADIFEGNLRVLVTPTNSTPTVFRFSAITLQP
jgi:hypothetical protein